MHIQATFQEILKVIILVNSQELVPHSLVETSLVSTLVTIQEIFKVITLVTTLETILVQMYPFQAETH